MAINTSRSLASIFSNSLRPFLETKNLFNNDLSVFCLMRSCFLDATQTLLRSNHPTQTCYCFSFVPTIFWRKIWKRSKKAAKSRKPFKCQRWTTLTGSKSFTRSLIGYTSACENSCTPLSDWLYKLFSHVKIKRIDFYKQALRNKILAIRVSNNDILSSWLTLTLTGIHLLPVCLAHDLFYKVLLRKT